MEVECFLTKQKGSALGWCVFITKSDAKFSQTLLNRERSVSATWKFNVHMPLLLGYENVLLQCIELIEISGMTDDITENIVQCLVE